MRSSATPKFSPRKGEPSSRSTTVATPPKISGLRMTRVARPRQNVPFSSFVRRGSTRSPIAASTAGRTIMAPTTPPMTTAIPA